MIALEEAQAKINRDLTVMPPVLTPIDRALGMVLAETVVADEAIPPFANTAMDGFALKASDSVGASKDNPVSLPVAATIAAGSVAPRPLESGEVLSLIHI